MSRTLREWVLHFIPDAKESLLPEEHDQHDLPLVELLQQALDHNPKCMLQVLECVAAASKSSIPLSSSLSFREFLCDLLPQALEADLPWLIGALLWLPPTSTSSSEPWESHALEAIRSEVALLIQETPNPMPPFFSICTLLFQHTLTIRVATTITTTQQDATSNSHFLLDYLQHVLWQAKESEISVQMTAAATADDNIPHAWNLLDVMMALLARVPIRPNHKGILEDLDLCHSVLDMAVLTTPSLVESLVDFVKHALQQQQQQQQQQTPLPSYLPTHDYDAFRNWLQTAMVWLTIHWTLSNNESLPLHGQTLGLALVTLEDESLTTELLCALQSVYRDAWSVVQNPSRLSIKKSNLQPTFDTAIKVLTTTNDIFLQILRSPNIQAPTSLGGQLEKFLQSEQMPLPMSVVKGLVACVVELYKDQPEELSRCCSILLVGGNMFPEEPADALVNPVEVRGLLFLQTWLTHPESTLDASHYTLAWEWVRSILLPTSLQRRRIVPPAVGSPCLELLRAMWTWKGPVSGPSVQSLASIQDLFLPTLTTVLSSTRLVRYIDPSSDAAPPATHTWGYREIPEELQLSTSTTSSNKKQMVFSFSAILQECPPAQLEDTCRWMFQLLDTYLWLGRGRPGAPKNWKPHPWVYAFLEVPILSFPSSHWESVAYIFTEFDAIELQSSGSNMTQELVEMVRNSGSSRQQRAQIMDQLIEYTYVLALGLAVSIALLKNTHQRYADSQPTGEKDHPDPTFPREAMSLIQYQLAKVLHLRQKCLTMATFLHRMDALEVANTKKRKRSSTQDAGSSSVGDQMSSVLSFLDENITTYFLCQCALDPSQDSKLVESVRTFIVEEDSSPEMTSLGWELRLCGLELLENKLRTFKSSNSLEGDLLILQTKFESFAGLVFRLLYLLEQRHHQTLSSTIFHRMVDSYFRILQQTLIASLEPPISSKSPNRPRKTFSRFLSLYISASNTNTKTSTSRNDFTQLHNMFNHHLDSCHEANIVVTLMETLSVFAVLSPNPVEHSKILETSWSTLRTTDSMAQNYSGSGSPYALQKVLYRIQSTPKTNLEKTALELVSKLANRLGQSGSQSWLIHCVLRHWGLSILLSPSMGALAKHWSELWLNLLQYLEHIKMKMPPNLRQTNVRDFDDDGDDDTEKPDDQSTKKSPATNTLEEDTEDIPSGDEEEEYLPPTHVDSDSDQLPSSVDRDDVELPPTNAPWLSRDHLALHIQLALDLTVATTAMVRLEPGTQWVPRNTSPYQSFLDLTATFGKLIRLVPACWGLLASPLVVATSCRSMVGLVDGICRDCKTWRNAQGVVVAADATRHDPASVHYFYALLVGLEKEIVEPILELCDELRLTRGYAVGTSTWKWLQKRTIKVESMLETQKQAHAVSGPTTANTRTTTTLMTMMDTEVSTATVSDTPNTATPTTGTRTITGTAATPNILTTRRKTSQRRETLRRVELTSLPSLPARSAAWAALSDTLLAMPLPPPEETKDNGMEQDNDSGESEYSFQEDEEDEVDDDGDDDDSEDNENDSFGVQGDWGKGDNDSAGEELQEE